MTKMRAVVQDRYGAPDKVLNSREVEIPTRAAIVQNRKYTNNRPGFFESLSTR